MTESLPDIISRAGNRLLLARNSGEVLEAKSIAEAALHYAKVTKAANETHADCLRIITRAEMRMANEVDAQPSVARSGQHREAVQTLDSLGLDRRRVAEWRDIRDAGEDVIEGALGRALADGRAPTKAEILQAAREIRSERQNDKAQRRQERERELAARQSSLPDKRYGVIYADPEWRFEVYSRDTGMDRAADNHYPTSSTEDICNRPVADIAADDCVLFLWATVPMLPDALRVMDAWDFQYKSHCVWAKDRIGTGYWFRNQHEILLVGTRGNVPAPAMGTQVESLVDAPVGRHSEKPEKFYQLIERYFPNLPKIELNARAARPGWDAWGYEAPIGTEAA
jgi:N6-adenosine-specific RNA methylase IME4